MRSSTKDSRDFKRVWSNCSDTEHTGSTSCVSTANATIILSKQRSSISGDTNSWNTRIMLWEMWKKQTVLENNWIWGTNRQFSISCNKSLCTARVLTWILFDTWLMKRQIVLTHTVHQSVILALPDSWVTNTPSVKMLQPLKIACSYFYINTKHA